MIWRDRYRNVESTHFQEEMMARGLAIKHLEVDPVPEVADTCLGFTAVAMAEVFSELETLGARGCLPGRSIESSWWVLKQFTPTLPNASMLGSF